MANPDLLRRQRSLLEHLTDPRAFMAPPGDAELQGIDPDRLRLIGRLSLGIREYKIRSALPKTCEFLAKNPRISMEAFGHAFPPDSISRYDNAVQFRAYLQDLWRDAPPDPPFLPDVVALELAIAKLGLARDRGAALAPDRAARAISAHIESRGIPANRFF